MSFLLDGGISLGSIAEAFANLTLLFGFFTTSGMSVIGVGWSLGVIFGFYILFPFFVYMIWDKKRAWFSLLMTASICFLCEGYFLSGGSLAFHWMCYLVLGGLIYLYKDSISKFFQERIWLAVIFVFVGFAVVYMVPFAGTAAMGTIVRLLKNMAGYTLMLAGALCADIKIWCNPVSRFISKVSLEIYISHMLIFRVIEKLNLTKIAGESVLSYSIACVGIIGGALLFAAAYQCVERNVKTWI